MTYNIGDPDHIGVHNQLTSDVQTAAAERGIDVDLPPQRNLGDDGHVKDHNLITDALAAVAAAGGGGKVLQVVRAKDNTNRSTNSESLVDVTGVSVNISPTSDTSAILVIATVFAGTSFSVSGDNRGQFTIKDGSGNAISGAQNGRFGVDDLQVLAPAVFQSYQTLIGYDTPRTTSGKTYKLCFASLEAATTTVHAYNSAQTAQIFAIEVAA